MTGVPLQAHLTARRDAGAKLLVPYVTGGLTDGWVDLVRRFADAGADAVEIGIPFSDPVMDGPTIQEASERALERGTTPTSILADLRGADIGVPLVVMTYANIAHQAGWARFAADLAASGITGAILPDLPLEESPPWEEAATACGVDTVLLAAPVSPDSRLAELGRRTRGFFYAVTVMGVTGARSSVSDAAAVLAKRCKAVTDVPVLLGFGVSTPDQARELTADADGVIVASVLMRMVLDGAPNDEVAADVAALRSGLGVTLYERLGGQPYFDALAARFYEGVAGDPVLRPMYPADPQAFAASAGWLAQFLAQYWGGPTTYSEQRGHPRLRARHLPFTIDDAARDVWVRSMRAAVEASEDVDPQDLGELWAYLESAADFLRNA